MSADIRTLAFTFHPSQRERFREGALVREWRDRYPQLFDIDDERVLKTEEQRRYHFFEWLSAVLLFEATGYRSLIEKYSAKSHPQKRALLRQLVSPRLDDWLSENQSGQPDLFVYHLTTLDWYFCEVKGPGDRIRENQALWLDQLRKALESEGLDPTARVRVLSLREM
jgi:hypothetical protein